MRTATRDDVEYDDRYYDGDDGYYEDDPAPARQPQRRPRREDPRPARGRRRRKPSRSKRSKRRERKAEPLPGVQKARLFRVAIVIALLLGVAGFVAAIWPTPPPPPISAEVIEAAMGEELRVPKDNGAAGFAELYVAEWLAAGRDSSGNLAAYTPRNIDLAQTPDSTFWAARTATVQSIELVDGSWEVIVGAAVIETRSDGNYPLGTRFYRVNLLKARDGEDMAFVASGLPAEVTRPSQVILPTLRATDLTQPSGELEVYATAMGGFLNGYLTGAGGLDRYTTTESGITPISPASFTSVSVREIAVEQLADTGNGPRVFTRVIVVATTGSGANQILEYTAELVQTDGRWEVAVLNPAGQFAS